MKKTALLATALAATLFAVSTPALHARSEPADQAAHQRGFNPAKLKEKLGLTDDQVAKIKSELRAQKGPLKEEAQKVRSARANLRQSVQSGAPENDLRSAAAALGSAEGDLAVVRAALFARIAPILTPEQLAKIRDLQAAR
jgi:Spy/CpxP family protein refolding chaperone